MQQTCTAVYNCRRYCRTADFLNLKDYASRSFKNFTSCTASLGPTMISHPGSLASRSPLRTATLPGITSLLHFTFGSTFSLMYSEMLFPENLPAAQDVRTESPPASLITRLSGTPERSSSPDTTKYVRAKSTVVTTREFSSALPSLASAGL